MPAPAPPAAALATAVSRPVTRADVVRLGQTGSPWVFLPLAQQALRARPDDHEMRFLAAAAFAKLMLVTPARDHLALLPGDLQGDPGVQALAAAIRQLPSDQIPIALLSHTCKGNLEALAGRSGDPIDLRAHLARWSEELADWQWLRARDGNIVRRRVEAGAVAGMNDRWIGLQDLRGQIAAVTLPHRAATGTSGNIPPYVLEGIDPPWLVERVLSETPAGADGYHSRVTIVQEDPIELLDGMAQIDLRERLAEPRVRMIVGPGAGRGLREKLLESLDTQLVGPGLSMSSLRTPMSPTVEACLQEATRRQVDEQGKLLARIEAVYGQRDAAWWKRRFQEGNLRTEASAPLRVLIPTCRFSTYIKHSSADLASAFDRLGCEARVLMEPDAHSHLSGVAYLRAIAEFQPDLVVMINYARGNINGLPGEQPGSKTSHPAIHPNIPYVMWIQDAMPHQLSSKVGAAMGPLDFLAGNLREEMFQTFGYPRSRSFNAPIVASNRKFHGGATSAELLRRHECELAYVSHHSETPDEMHARKAREGAANPMLVRLIGLMKPLIEQTIAGPIGQPIATQLESMAKRIVADSGGDGANRQLISQLLHMYALPMADRIMRHQTLGWAAEICDRRGWRMHLHGRGWEKHPTLAAHARGELQHDEDLRACYLCAKAHLQVSAHTVIHQRVVECMLSGGLPLARLQADDLSSLEYAAAIEGAKARMAAGEECDVCDPWRRIGDRWRYFGYGVEKYPETAEVADLRRRLGLPFEPHIWLNSVHLDRLRQGDPGVNLPAERSLKWLYAQPEHYLFANAQSLERLLVLAVENEPWRRERIAALGGRARADLTDEAFAQKLLNFVTSRL